MKEKLFEGKTWAELDKLPLGQLSNGAIRFLKENDPNNIPTAGRFSTFVRSTMYGAKAAGRVVSEAVVNAVENTKVAIANEEKIATVNKYKEQIYQRALLDTALKVGDIDKEEYDEKVAALDE